MAAAEAWRKQHNSLGGEIGQVAHHPRSLTSMLADSRFREQRPDRSVSKTTDDAPEGELDGESEFIALSEDVAPLFQARRLSSAARKVGSRDTSSRELLTDLFPAGFTSNTLTPLAAATAAAATDRDKCKPAPARAIVGETEPELRGQQVWACLMPKEAPATAATTSSNDASDVGRETELRLAPENTGENHSGQSPLHPSPRPSHHPNSDELGLRSSKIRERNATCENISLGSSNAKVTTATKGADLHAPAPAVGIHVRTETAEVAGRERENDLKHALDRLVPRFMQSQEKVSRAVRKLCSLVYSLGLLLMNDTVFGCARYRCTL